MRPGYILALGLIILSLLSGCRTAVETNSHTPSNTASPAATLSPVVTSGSAPGSAPAVSSPPATTSATVLPNISPPTTPAPSPVPAPSLSPSPTTSLPPTTKASPAPPASTSPSPSGTPENQLLLTIISEPLEVSRGTEAVLIAATAPGAQCNLTINYKSGPVKLSPQVADANGIVSWRWVAGGESGIWTIVVEASKDGVTATQITAFVVR